MKKILISLMAIALVIGLVGAGTMAYFSDTETSSGNTFTAGTLDLTVSATGMPFNVGPMKPGDSGSGKIALTNAGTIGAAKLDISMSTVTNNDVSTADPENDLGTNSGLGDLGGQLQMVLWLDVEQNGAFDAGDVELLSDGTMSAYDATDNPSLTYAAADTYSGDSWNKVLTAMAQDAVDDFVISYNLPADTDNRIMTDTITFDVTFTLEQGGVD